MEGSKVKEKEREAEGARMHVEIQRALSEFTARESSWHPCRCCLKMPLRHRGSRYAVRRIQF